VNFIFISVHFAHKMNDTSTSTFDEDEMRSIEISRKHNRRSVALKIKREIWSRMQEFYGLAVNKKKKTSLYENVKIIELITFVFNKTYLTL
jgi:predicted acetyltransferase